MIRKLKNGQYRIYSRRIDEKTGKRRNLGGKAAPRSLSPRKREEARSAMRSWPRPRIHSYPILHDAGQ